MILRLYWAQQNLKKDNKTKKITYKYKSSYNKISHKDKRQIKISIQGEIRILVTSVLEYVLVTVIITWY